MLTAALDSSALAGDPAECHHVLIIERDEVLRTLLRWLIEDRNCSVLLARDIADAAWLPELRSVDLILAEVSEPGIAGKDGLRNRLAPEACLLWFDRDGRDLLEAGEEDAVVLRGPFRADALAEKVHELLAAR